MPTNTITDVMEGLLEQDREKLMLLFNSHKSGFIEYNEGLVIGVNDPPSTITVTLKAGRWYLGTKGSA